MQLASVGMLSVAVSRHRYAVSVALLQLLHDLMRLLERVLSRS
jgi:hypothetical protein